MDFSSHVVTEEGAMDSINSFAGHSKKTAAEEQAYRSKSRRRLVVIAASSFILLAIIICVSAAAIAYALEGKSSGGKPVSQPAVNSIMAVCSSTRYPDSCYSSISSARGPNSNGNDDPEEIFKLSVQVALAGVSAVGSFPSKENSTAGVKALQDCRELYESAAGHLNETLAMLQAQSSPENHVMVVPKIGYCRTLLSAAVADQATCAEGLAAVPGAEAMAAATVNSTEYTSNSLAIATEIGRYTKTLQFQFHGKLLSSEPLRTLPAPNLTVAKNGTGDFETIGAALEKTPEKSSSPFVIYVREGVYEENVLVGRSKWNVILLGDGMNRTIVSGSRNTIDGETPYKSATFTVEGRGFMARDMTFINSAVPEKNQAVAVLSKSDRSIFHRCAFQAFQNTLWAHSLRQFYRECEISGAVDIISGDAAVVFQNCSIRPRRPLDGRQKVTITAQSRTDPNENTGISIHGGKIAPFDRTPAAAYLGRPVSNFSRTVIMETEMGDVVATQGWVEPVTGTVPADTIFFGEYRNTGPGSIVTGRVNWAGYRPTMTENEAQEFQADTFIDGRKWIGT